MIAGFPLYAVMHWLFPDAAPPGDYRLVENETGVNVVDFRIAGASSPTDAELQTAHDSAAFQTWFAAGGYQRERRARRSARSITAGTPDAEAQLAIIDKRVQPGVTNIEQAKSLAITELESRITPRPARTPIR